MIKKTDDKKTVLDVESHIVRKDYVSDSPVLNKDFLHDYQKSALEQIYFKDFYASSLDDYYTKSKYSSATTVDPNMTQPYYTSVDLSSLSKMTKIADSYYDKWATYDKYITPRIKKSEKTIEVTMDDGSVESISREDLIKYISEQRIVRENEVVRKVYERYQVAVKLVRSDDNGDTGV